MDKLEYFRATKGTCCKEIIFSVNKENVLTNCKFVHGCSGNQQAISRLCIGKNIDEIIGLLKGIQCRDKTSCPDMLATALMDYKARLSQPATKK